MESTQLQFALVSSLALAVLGAFLALIGMAGWGLAVVATLLIATTAYSWWQRNQVEGQGAPAVVPVKVRAE